MNREIKFRAWNKKENRFLNSANLMISSDGLVWWQFGLGEPRLLEQDDLVLMQYTGLKDKNGKEIYEGCILRTSWGEIGVVIFDNTGFTLFRKNPQRYVDHDSEFFEDCEILGDIFQNPELIKEQR
jgi:uncharacterized phage protein (TIGR01671 family)